MDGIWRSISVRIYLAVGFTALLSLAPSAVGVYYFERSGDLSYQAQFEAVPALEASWSAVRAGERMHAAGLALLVEPGGGFDDAQTDSLDATLTELEAALVGTSRVSELASEAEAVQDAAYNLAGVIDRLAANREAKATADAAAVDLQRRLNEYSVDSGLPPAATVLQRMLVADSEVTLNARWDEFEATHAAGVDPAVAILGAGRDGVFAVRGQQLTLQANRADLADDFSAAGRELDQAMTSLLGAASRVSSEALESSRASFDRGRVLLAVVSAASVVAILATWLWVSISVARRLSRR